MEFLINRSAFLESLSKANKVIDVKNINPSMGGVLIDVELDKITVVSTNGILSFKAILTNNNSDLEVKKPGKILIKTKYVLEMLRRLEEKEITLIVVEKNELKIKTEKIEFNVGILDPEDFPLIGFRDKGIEIDINPIEFKRAISQTIVSIDEWNKKIALTGMNFRIKNQKMFVSTTDMYRISQKVIKLDNLVDDVAVNVTIPHKTIIDLPRLLDNVKKFKMVVSETSVTFIMDDSYFQTNIIDGQYPIVESVFPQDFNLNLKVNTKSFLKSLNRADLPTDDGLSPTINLNIDQQKIVLKANINEIGNFEEEFTDFTTTSNSNLIINFNSKFLTEAIRTFDGEYIELKFVGPTKPIVINNQNDSDLKQIVLPTYIAD